jgi:hypothetical protein
LPQSMATCSRVAIAAPDLVKKNRRHRPRTKRYLRSASRVRGRASAREFANTRAGACELQAPAPARANCKHPRRRVPFTAVPGRLDQLRRAVPGAGLARHHSGGCRTAAPIAETSVASRGHLARSRFFTGRAEERAKRDWGSRCRRRSVQPVGFWPSEEIFLVLVLQKQKCVLFPRLPPFCPSCEISKALDTSCQHASSPKRSRGSAWRRYGSFCKRSASWQP